MHNCFNFFSIMGNIVTPLKLVATKMFDTQIMLNVPEYLLDMRPCTVIYNLHMLT